MMDETKFRGRHKRVRNARVQSAGHLDIPGDLIRGKHRQIASYVSNIYERRDAETFHRRAHRHARARNVCVRRISDNSSAPSRVIGVNAAATYVPYNLIFPSSFVSIIMYPPRSTIFASNYPPYATGGAGEGGGQRGVSPLLDYLGGHSAQMTRATCTVNH